MFLFRFSYFQGELDQKKEDNKLRSLQNMAFLEKVKIEIDKKDE